MAHYKDISINEMRDFLRSDKGWTESQSDGNTKEAVFNYNLKNHPFILVRVYTGIKDGQSRDVGRDAIRVCAVNLQTDRGWIKSKRVHRVNGWQLNLKNRICQVIKDSNDRFLY